MLQTILIGSAMTVVNLGIQVWALALVISFFRRLLEREARMARSRKTMQVLAITMLVLLLGHFLQFSTWALLFLYLGEFSDFETAFYHSTVNFTSLGYGDIVMSERWRLLGALEAANGVLMFGLTAGFVLSVMDNLFRQHKATGPLRAEGQKIRGEDR